MNHLELSFVWSDEYVSVCILLHANLQLDQKHLLKMLSFLYDFAFFVKNQVP